jgi:hypothetical protein
MKLIGAMILGMFFGVLMMVGLYVFLVENGTIDPSSVVGLAFPVAGIVIGLIAAIFGGRRVAA